MKRVRQYIGILAAAAAYYSVHEGARYNTVIKPFGMIIKTFKESAV